MPADGSSRRIIAGFERIVIATLSLRLLPPDRFLAILLLSDWRLSSYIHLSTSLDMFLTPLNCA